MPDFPAPVLAVLVPVVALVLGVVGYLVYQLAQPAVTRRARLTGKRRAEGGYCCTFEFEGGQREEYDVSVETYVALADHDVGYVTTKGKLFWGFRREPSE